MMGARDLQAPMWSYLVHLDKRVRSDNPLPEGCFCPGLRYAFVKVTDGTMTAHKGVWSWTAQKVVNQRLVENASP
jgi:hypothetical protein